ncbi:hypothetical protein [Paenibacillus sp. IHBB 10380]|uniref:hypothetical protein n=1 Tax=Paenibacillus sp. IHBB 10380 TaxID=1566358 RepID=UPI0005CFD0EC|nr:hypothetical protein [Paenibacillus sp. IHBB 10380]AJS59092.1 hypothetical protein UB51_12190 [Paenibacillus sp. IHBB 10380]
MNVINKRKTTFVSITILFIGIIFAGVFLLNNNKYEPKTYNVNSYSDYATSGNVKGSVERADYIVTGHYEKFIKDMDLGSQHMGEVYSFKVEDSLLGDVEGSIRVSIANYQIMKQTIEGYDYEAKVGLPNHVKPDFNKKYVLFLRFVEDIDMYGSAVLPNHIELDDSGTATLNYNQITTGEDVNTKGDKAIFSVGEFNIPAMDKITGMTQEELFEQIKVAIANKKAQVE